MAPARCVHAVWLAAWLFAVPALAADDAPDIAKVCAAQSCRDGGYEAVVAVDAEHYTTIPVSHSPYVLEDGSLLVFPGETLAVQFARDGDNLGAIVSVRRMAPRYPAQIANPGASPAVNPADAALPALPGGLPAEETAALPPDTLLVSYGQMDPKGLAGMQLQLEHNFTRALKLTAILNQVRPGTYNTHATSTCTVMPRMFDQESWPDVLGPIILGRFRFQDDTMVCN
jgi:hypothetical protein